MNNKLCFIALSFGSGENYGVSNYYIAKNLAEEMRIQQCAGIAQWEVHDIIQRKFADLIEGLPLDRLKAMDKYFDTQDALKMAADIVEKKHYTSITYVGHPAHMWRARRVALKLGIPEDEKRRYKIPYDKKSGQWWTRTWWQFWSREIFVIIFWKMLGWL